VGCAVGDAGTIVRTADGGATWTSAQAGAPSIASAGFTNSVAYDIASLIKTSFDFTTDASNVKATLKIDAGTAGTWTLATTSRRRTSRASRTSW
jgi:hypothetical protein